MHRVMMSKNVAYVTKIMIFDRYRVEACSAVL
jgi:hypothetical protein